MCVGTGPIMLTCNLLFKTSSALLSIPATGNMLLSNEVEIILEAAWMRSCLLRLAMPIKDMQEDAAGALAEHHSGSSAVHGQRPELTLKPKLRMARGQN